MQVIGFIISTIPAGQIRIGNGTRVSYETIRYSIKPFLMSYDKDLLEEIIRLLKEHGCVDSYTDVTGTYLLYEKFPYKLLYVFRRYFSGDVEQQGDNIKGGFKRMYPDKSVEQELLKVLKKSEGKKVKNFKDFYENYKFKND
jgi:hypothetical protein